MFNFTPLLGAQSASLASQSLLEFDGGIQILIDVGWDDSFDIDKLKEIEKHVQTLSFILLTHATTAHLGAYVHCCKNFPLFTRIPVYATNPVISLGRTLLQDMYSSTPLASSILSTETLNESAYSFPLVSRGGGRLNILLPAPAPEEIAEYFARINPLRYSQPHQPIPSPHSPPLNGLTITAYSAGHTLGGSIWHIQHGMESVVYAVDWNQAREHVLSGAAWLGGPGTGGSEVLEQLRRPTALICSSRGTGVAKVAKSPNKRDATLLAMIRETVANGGSVLIPTGSSARMLELAYLLEGTWKKETSNSDTTSPLRNTRVFLASRTAGATMRYARSMLEWMTEGIVKEFEAAAAAAEVAEQDKRTRGLKGVEKEVKGPFDFRHITLLERKSHVNRMLGSNEPCVILASDASLEWGFSKDVIKSLASDSKNLVILTERDGNLTSPKKALGRYLLDLWNEKRSSHEESSIVNVQVHAPIRNVRTFALQGDELPLYQQFLASQRQRQTTMGTDAGAMLETSADVVDDRSSSSSESSEGSGDGYRGKVLNATVALQHARNKLGLSDTELGVNVLIRRKNVHDFEVQGKRGKERVFPFQTKKKRTDEFGELIRPEEFARAEEDNITGEALRNEATNNENAVGQKRRWDEKKNTIGASKANPYEKRRKDDGEQADESDSDAGEDEDKVDGPSKVIIESETLEIQCKIGFVDFSGLHDQRTIQQLLPLIKPRKLIFIAGEESETRELATLIRDSFGAMNDTANFIDVFTPTDGVMIDASVDTNAWSVKLSRSMVRNLRWQTVRGMGVVAITGRFAAASLNAFPEEGETPAKKKARLDLPAVPVSSQDKTNTIPILDVVPTNTAAAVRSVAQPFHVGDLRLADLRKIMNRMPGMKAEFRGEGVLVVNGTVAVRKMANGQIEVDGGAYGNIDAAHNDAATFYKVKRQIYEGLAVVAGR